MFTYRFSAVSATVGGLPVTGFAEGVAVEVDSDKDLFTKQIGADGQTTRSQQTNITGKITFHLMQTSASNDYFSTLALLDRSVGLGARPITLRDASGRSVTMTALGWVMKMPKQDFQVDSKERTWVIDCTDLIVQFLGGN